MRQCNINPVSLSSLIAEVFVNYFCIYIYYKMYIVYEFFVLSIEIF